MTTPRQRKKPGRKKGQRALPLSAGDDLGVNMHKAFFGVGPQDRVLRLVSYLKQLENGYWRECILHNKVSDATKLALGRVRSELLEMVKRAILRNDADWLDHLANTVRHWKERQGAPTDKARFAFMRFIGNPGKRQSDKTVADVQEFFVNVLKYHHDHPPDPRQIRRWCRELGVTLAARAKSGRRRDSHNRHNQK